METYIIPDWAAVIVEFGYNDNTTEQEDQLFAEFVRAIGPFKYLSIGRFLPEQGSNAITSNFGDCYELFVNK